MLYVGISLCRDIEHAKNSLPAQGEALTRLQGSTGGSTGRRAITKNDGLMLTVMMLNRIRFTHSDNSDFKGLAFATSPFDDIFDT